MNAPDAKPLADILIVDDTPANLRLLSHILNEQGYYVRPVLYGAQALAAAQARPPDLILLDVRMPGMDGYAVCQQLKADERTRAIPVLFISALGETEDKVKAFHAGGVDYITKPFQREEVLARVHTHLALSRAQAQLEAANRDLKEALASQERLARTDWLTGALNRSHFFALASQSLAGAMRYQQPSAVLMMDIDHFKEVNDRFGHPAGDAALKQVAQCIAQQLRSADFFGRYGGEEFIALLPMTPAAGALIVAERILAAVRALQIAVGQDAVMVTLSIGVTALAPGDAALEPIIDRADRALYAAKRAGRNCAASA